VDNVQNCEIKDFKHNGFATVSQVISPDRVEELRCEATALAEEMKNSGHKSKTITDIYVLRPQWFDTFLNERMTSALRDILGTEYVLLPDSSVSFRRFNVLHADVTSWEVNGLMIHQDPAFLMVTAGLYLQDSNEYGGGLWIVPGSHEKPDPIVNIRRKNRKLPMRIARRLGIVPEIREQCERCELNKLGFDVKSHSGDAIIFDVIILHRASMPVNLKAAPYGAIVAFLTGA
jgi:ectoine hydroxylase-related dioxygenase (phytanoyl-CoA dioxygenase family)